ncbi:hypothetical protein [Microcystis phage MinS1]|nr:hypothetical protein [Microcystis phage MinS1]
MRPTPIPDHEIWHGAHRQVIAPPDGDLTNPDIAPVEALVDRSPNTGVRVLSVRCELEPGDLEQLQAGGTVWLSFFGAMVPWAATVVAPQLAAWERRLLEEATAEAVPLVWEGDQA